jgi:N-acetylmuramoyl-L-alanine amidase
MVRYSIVVAALLAAAPAFAAAPPARALFADATQKEQAVRAALSDPAASSPVLKSVHQAIGEYETLVRHYPTSGYSDDALWRAGHLALDAFNRFGNAQDHETGVRLLRWLAAEYPTSKLAKRVPGVLAAAEDRSKDGVTRKPQASAARTNGPKELEPARRAPAAAAGNSVRATPADGQHSAASAGKTAALTGIRRVLLPDVVRITIALDAEVAFHDERIAGPSRIFIDFPAALAKASLVDRTMRFDQDGDAVRQVRIGRLPSTGARVVLDAEGISSYSVYPLYNPYRLVVDLVRSAGAPRPASTPALSASLGQRQDGNRGSLLDRPTPAAAPGHQPLESAVRPRTVTEPDPGRSAPLASMRIGSAAGVALPSASPAAAGILEAARVTPFLNSHSIGTIWMRRMPAGSPRETEAILEATRVPDTLASRTSAPVFGRSLPNASAARAALIIDAARTPQPLASRNTTPPFSRGLPNASPVRTAAIAEALRPPVSTLTASASINPTVHGLPNGSAGSAAGIVEATRRAQPLPSRLFPIQPAPALPNITPAAAWAIAEALAPAAGAPAPNLGGFSMARQLGLGVSRIVIDPGHGGHDPGAKGKGGINESELVLDVSLRLEKLLQKMPGLDVVLTRHTDEFIALSERTAIANREGADLFLSIHANASPNDQAQGVETYFLNFANNLTAAAVAARENTTSGQAMGALPDFVRAIALNNKVDESRDFATRVQQAMVEGLRSTNQGVKDLGVKQAPFVVLIGASMPSVLAEISFLTNEQEARLLKSSAYRQKIAEALAEAVQQYQGSLKRVQTIAHQ